MTLSTEQRKLRPENMKETLIRLFGYFKHNKILLILGVTFIIIGSLGTIAANSMLSPIIDSLITDKDHTLFIRYLTIMGIIVGFIALGEYLGNMLLARLAQRTVHQIREEMFSHMAKLPISFFDRYPHGELMSTFTNDVDMLNQSLEQSVSQVVLSFVTVIGTFIMMIIISPLLTGVVVAMLGVMLIAVKYVGQRSARYFRAQQRQLAEINGYIEEMMTGQKVVKVFNFEERAIGTFTEKNERLRRSSTFASTYGVMLMPIMGSLSFVLYGLVSMLGAYLILMGTITIGNIAAFLQFTRAISRPITQVSNQVNLLLAAIAGAERIFKILDEKIETDTGDVRLVEDCTGKSRLCWEVPTNDGNVMNVPLRGFITFENVNFGYLPGRKTLKNINLYAKPGQRIAFVGSTGAGKTTVTNLINRFYEIDSGVILFDGIDIRRINKHDLRSTMGIVLQDTHLFTGTVTDNIRYGRLNATDEEVVAAAKLANAHYFIKNLPQGYDTMLTSDGENLSQGERQLLSIARAAIANPVILILDEATSSVDTRTEKLIARGMDKLMEGRTTFVIAHRLSTVRHANAIMVLEYGEIIERGDHSDLMQQKGRYYALNTGAAELE
ncbi:MAG: ABC transporter ATP-binding protein [Firmicutes bacterium]|nr:ABC transporter ATP-binding protein [Bacillota bacterium]